MTGSFIMGLLFFWVKVRLMVRILSQEIRRGVAVFNASEERITKETFGGDCNKVAKIHDNCFPKIL